MQYSTYMEKIRSARMEEAVQAAAELMLQKGIDNVRMVDIAEKSGIGVASLYRYFGTKVAIAAAAAAGLWEREKTQFTPLLIGKDYDNISGAKQVEKLLGVFVTIYKADDGFFRFLADFDAFILKERSEGEEMDVYENSVSAPYELFEKACMKGNSDGTLKVNDIRGFYLTSTHALLAMCQKFSSGVILRADSRDHAVMELEMLTEALINLIRKEKENG